MEEKQAEKKDENITVDVPGKINDRGIFLSQTQEDAAKIRELQEPGRPMSSLAVGTIRGSKIKSSTKALEKIIKRQEKRILELSTKLGQIQCVTATDGDNWKRLLISTKSSGVSEALAKVDALVEYLGAKGMHLCVAVDDIKYSDPAKKAEEIPPQAPAHE